MKFFKKIGKFLNSRAGSYIFYVLAVASFVLDKKLYDETDKYAGGLGNTVINLRDKDTGLIYYAFVLMNTGDWQNM